MKNNERIIYIITIATLLILLLIVMKSYRDNIDMLDSQFQKINSLDVYLNNRKQSK